VRILYLDLDTLRPDHLGCYGYHRNTSPNIDAIAKEGIKFTNYHCSDAPCLPSRTALMSGRFGIRTGVVGHGGTAADMRLEGKSRAFKQTLNNESLPGFLRKQGFKTISISPFAERHSAWWFNAGFNEMYNTGKSGMESAEEITPVVLDWIKRSGKDDNWFLQLNYWDAHAPYRTPANFDNPFKNDPVNFWIDDKILAEHRSMPGPHGAQDITMYNNKLDPRYPKHLGEIKDMKDLRKMIDGYDSGIRYMDGHLGQLFAAFRKIGVFEDMMIIVSSDHGENMGELGLYGEHATADRSTTRIPMIIRLPEGKTTKTNDGLHYNLDLPPTIAEYLGAKAPEQWDGQSYAKAFDSEDDCGREYLVVGQCAHGCQRGVRFGKWMYIRTYHDFYHLFPKEMLFDIENDPYEQHNLAGEYPAICHHAAHILLSWHDDTMMKSSSDRDPLWTVMKEGGGFHSRGYLKEYCNFLESTGRGNHIAELKRRHPDEFKA
jgi:arylsulfatase A-like enzyme